MKEVERFGDGVGRPYYAYRYYLCDRGKVKHRPRHVVAVSRGIWNLDVEGGRLQVYATCHSCGWANNISGHIIDSRNGRVRSECVVCSNNGCQVHFFPELVGWKSSFNDRIWRYMNQIKRRADVR